MPVGNAQCTTVGVPAALEGRDGERDHGLEDDDVDVEDGLGSEIGYRGTTDVLDGEDGYGEERFLKGGFDLGER